MRTEPLSPTNETTPSPRTSNAVAGVDIAEPRAERRRGGPGTGNVVVAIVVVLLLYVLSIGPVGAYYNNLAAKSGSSFSEPWHLRYVRAFYWPLTVVFHRFPVLLRLCMNYSTWCEQMLCPSSLTMPPMPSRPPGPHPTPSPSPAPAPTPAPTSP